MEILALRQVLTQNSFGMERRSGGMISMEIEGIEEGRSTSKQQSIIDAHRKNTIKMQQQRQQQKLKQQQTVKTELGPEQDQGGIGASELATVLIKALKIATPKAKPSQSQRARQDPRSSQLFMQQNENLNKAGGEEAKVSKQTRLLSARKSGTVVALQGLLSPKETSKASGKKDSTVEEFDEGAELSEDALSILDRNKEREINSAKMRNRSTGPKHQNFLNQNQGAQIKRFVNPNRNS